MDKEYCRLGNSIFHKKIRQNRGDELNTGNIAGMPTYLWWRRCMEKSIQDPKVFSYKIQLHLTFSVQSSSSSWCASFQQALIRNRPLKCWELFQLPLLNNKLLQNNSNLKHTRYFVVRYLGRGLLGSSSLGAHMQCSRCHLRLQLSAGPTGWAVQEGCLSWLAVGYNCCLRSSWGC